MTSTIIFFRENLLCTLGKQNKSILVIHSKMKKELLKGFSLLALIIVLALMTAVASVSANTSTEDETYTAVTG